MECQVEKLEHFRHFLFFEFNRGAKAADATWNTWTVYGDNAIGGSTARKLFSHFKEDRSGISDTLRSGRLLGFDEDRLNTLIHNDPCQCARELENVSNCDHSTIVRHLHSMGKVQKSGVWVPHALNHNHKSQRVAICKSFLARLWLAHVQHRPFLSCIVNGDEKGCFYANIRKRKEWLSPKFRKMFQFLHLTSYKKNHCTPLTWILASTVSVDHRCGRGVTEASHVTGPGWIPGLVSFPGWGFFGVFLTCNSNVRKT